MNKLRSSNRCCVVDFNRSLTDDEKEALKRRLLQTGVAEINFTGNKCRIYYPFPDLTREVIIQALMASDIALEISPVLRLLNFLTVFMENNEHSHIVQSGGWSGYVEDVYIKFFNRYRIEREDIRKQTWRKYNK